MCVCEGFPGGREHIAVERGRQTDINLEKKVPINTLEL